MPVGIVVYNRRRAVSSIKPQYGAEYRGKRGKKRENKLSGGLTKINSAPYLPTWGEVCPEVRVMCCAGRVSLMVYCLYHKMKENASSGSGARQGRASAFAPSLFFHAFFHFFVTFFLSD
jgi:hypothetical protein